MRFSPSPAILRLFQLLLILLITWNYLDYFIQFIWVVCCLIKLRVVWSITWFEQTLQHVYLRVLQWNKSVKWNNIDANFFLKADETHFQQIRPWIFKRTCIIGQDSKSCAVLNSSQNLSFQKQYVINADSSKVVKINLLELPQDIC